MAARLGWLFPVHTGPCPGQRHGSNRTERGISADGHTGHGERHHPHRQHSPFHWWPVGLGIAAGKQHALAGSSTHDAGSSAVEIEGDVSWSTALRALARARARAFLNRNPGPKLWEPLAPHADDPNEGNANHLAQSELRGDDDTVCSFQCDSLLSRSRGSVRRRLREALGVLGQMFGS